MMHGQQKFAVYTEEYLLMISISKHVAVIYQNKTKSEECILLVLILQMYIKNLYELFNV
jgi:hypothetical protein